MAGIKEEIELDVSGALRDVARLEAALHQTAQEFKRDLSKSTDVLRGNDGRFVAKVKVDDDGTIKKAEQGLDKVETEAKQAGKAAGDLGGRFDGVRTAVAGALAALGTRFVVAEIGKMINAASDLAESQSKVDVVFGNSAEVISKWAETSATSVGLAKQEALEAAGTFGNLFTAMGLSAQEAANVSPQVVQLAADFASFNNLEVPEVLEKLRSGLVGEIEPLRSLGVSFDAAAVEAKAMALGLVEANGEVSEGAKVQARWALILDQSTAAQGDFARTSDGLANQSRIMRAELQNARAEIGERLLPVMLDVVRHGRSFLDFFMSLPAPLQNALLGFVGLGIAIGPLLLAVGNVSKAVSGVGAALGGLSKLLGASTLSLGAWAAGLAAIGILLVAWKRTNDAAREGVREIDADMSKAVNTAAAFAAAGRDSAAETDALADALARGEIEWTDFILRAREARELTGRYSEQAEVAADVLRTLARESGVTADRIAQLATEMGVNLGNATDEQREALAAAVTEIAGAVTPTDRLKEAAKTLGNEFATAEEEIKAFKDALDAALGVYLSAEEATIRVRQRVDELAEAFKKGAEEGENHQQFQDRLTLSTIDLTRAVADEVEQLTADGRISSDAAAQKEALTSRLRTLADTLGGPMAQKLREHADQIEEIPDAAVTDVQADTTQATDAVEALPGVFASKGTEAGASFFQGTASGLDQGVQVAIKRARAAAQRVIGEVFEIFGIASPSKVGIQIGAFFAEGIALGVEREAALATQAADALAAGVGEVVWEAAQFTAKESQRIFDALMQMHDAEERLADLRQRERGTPEEVAKAEIALSQARERLTDVNKDAKASETDRQSALIAVREAEDALVLARDGREVSALELAKAESDLASAQEAVNDAVYEGRDASDELTDALEAQRRAQEELNAALDRSLGMLDAVNSRASAARRVRDAERALAEAQKRQSELPGEISAAERELSDARREAAATTAEEELAILRARENVSRAESEYAAVLADSATTADQRRTAELELDVARERLNDTTESAVGPTRRVEEAERDLKALREEQIEITERVRDATENLQSAQLALVDSQRQLNEAGEEFAAGGGQAMIDVLVEIARQAGLSEEAISSLVDALNDASSPRGSASRPPTTAPKPGDPFPYGPPGTLVTRNGKRYIVDYDGQLTLLSASTVAVRATTATAPRTSSSTSTTTATSTKAGVTIEKVELRDAATIDLFLAKTEFAVSAGRFSG